MHASTLWKTLPVALLAMTLQMPVAMAGATNSGDNTSAQPGDNSSTTSTPADAGHDRRKGTSSGDDMKSSKSKHDKHNKKSTSGSGSSNTDSSSTGTGTSGSGY